MALNMLDGAVKMIKSILQSIFDYFDSRYGTYHFYYPNSYDSITVYKDAECLVPHTEPVKVNLHYMTSENIFFMKPCPKFRIELHSSKGDILEEMTGGGE